MNEFFFPAVVPKRAGRPARKGRKPGPKPKQKSSEDAETILSKTETVKTENVEQIDQIKIEKTESTPVKTETRRKKRSIMGLDIADVETIQAAAENDAPIRQSRRIAQIKIREEADRRKAEEIALSKMKEGIYNIHFWISVDINNDYCFTCLASEKKKKGGSSKLRSESEEENSESEAKLEKKKPRKKGNKDRPWQTDSDVSSERDEEDNDDHEDVERLVNNIFSLFSLDLY